MNMIGLILYDCVYLMKVNTYASLGGVVMNSPNLYKRWSMHLINLAQLNKLY